MIDDRWSAARSPRSTEITFPQPAALLNMNHRGHWSTRARLTASWRTAGYQAALLLGPSALRSHGPSWVQVQIPVPTRARRDPANLTPITKAVVDGLVDAGCWPDDTPEFVTTIEPLLVLTPPVRGIASTVRIFITPRKGATPQ